MTPQLLDRLDNLQRKVQHALAAIGEPDPERLYYAEGGRVYTYRPGEERPTPYTPRLVE